MKKDFCFLFFLNLINLVYQKILYYFCVVLLSPVKHLEYLQYKIQDSIGITKLVFLTFVDHTTVQMRLIHSFVKYCQLIIFKFAYLHTPQLGTNSCCTCHITMLHLHLVFCVDKTVRQQQLLQRSGYLLTNNLPGYPGVYE